MPDGRLYCYFYLIGRDEDDSDIPVDLDELAKRVLRGQEVLAVAHGAALLALRDTEIDGTKHRWLEANKDEVTEAGGNGETAWSHYAKGRVDALARDLEQGVLGEMATILDELDDDMEDDEPEDDDDEPVDHESDDSDDDPLEDGDNPWAAETRAIDQRHDDVRPSLRARYDRWEARGRADCDASHDLGHIKVAAAEYHLQPTTRISVAAVQVIEGFWIKAGRRIRRDWRAQHMDELVTDGLRIAKAYNRWVAGWRELAYETVEADLKARQGKSP
jgi:hypothetical protein